MPKRHLSVLFEGYLDHNAANDHTLRIAVMITNKREFDRSFELRTKKKITCGMVIDIELPCHGIADRVPGLHTSQWTVDDGKLISETGDARLGEVYVKPHGLRKVRPSKSNLNLASRMLEIKRVNKDEVGRWVSIRPTSDLQGDVKGAIKVIAGLKNIPTTETLAEAIRCSGQDPAPLSETDRLRARRHFVELKKSMRNRIYDAVIDVLSPKDRLKFEQYMRPPKLLGDDYFEERGWVRTRN